VDLSQWPTMDKDVLEAWLEGQAEQVDILIERAREHAKVMTELDDEFVDPLLHVNPPVWGQTEEQRFEANQQFLAPPRDLCETL
jgi:hypothetical protein